MEPAYVARNGGRSHRSNAAYEPRQQTIPPTGSVDFRSCGKAHRYLREWALLDDPRVPPAHPIETGPEPPQRSKSSLLLQGDIRKADAGCGQIFDLTCEHAFRAYLRRYLLQKLRRANQTVSS